MSLTCIITAYPKEDAFGRRLVAAYRAGVLTAGQQLTVIDVYQLRFDAYASLSAHPRLPDKDSDLKKVADLISHCQHLTVFVPVHADRLPVVTQAFFQQLFATDSYGRPNPALWGNLAYLHLKTARIISTLDAAAWQAFQHDRSARFHPLKKSMLELLGFRKVRTTTVPPAYDLRDDNSYVQRWVGKMEKLGEKSF